MMLNNPEEFKTLLNTVTEILKEDGQDNYVELLTNAQISIEQTDFDNWNGGTSYYTIYLVVDVKAFVNYKEYIDSIESEIKDFFIMAIRGLNNQIISKVIFIPKANNRGAPPPNPHRPFSEIERKRKENLTTYLSNASEDELIEKILLPLFRQLGFHRITIAGHRDKALEYGKDIWMKFVLPTQHVLYFGIQVKKGKIDSSGITKSGNANVAEIHNQATMMLGHEIFDPEIGKKVLVDHAFIVSGGEITKAARNWIGGQLDTSKRSQIIFMDKDDILNLFVVANIPLPTEAVMTAPIVDDLPF